MVRADIFLAVLLASRIFVLPSEETEKSVEVADAVEDAIKNTFLFVSPLFALIASFANGDVEPTPTFPDVARKREDVAVMVLVPEKYGTCPVLPVKRDEVAMVIAPEVPPTNEPRVPE